KQGTVRLLAQHQFPAILERDEHGRVGLAPAKTLDGHLTAAAGHVVPEKTCKALTIDPAAFGKRLCSREAVCFHLNSPILVCVACQFQAADLVTMHLVRAVSEAQL